ncbi:MAG TPA: rhodanese-like domain-containing protein [Dehalococcoidia bacterium]|nr:rhodanese-like domain-containing protein [Dehalococcoidia bacterium]
MTVRPIGHREVQELLKEGAVIFDALPPDHYQQRHIPGAINLPLSDVNDGAIAGLERDRPVITYCADNQCDLSPRLAAWLAAKGFTRAYDYVASLDDWTARGLPIEGEHADVATAGNLARDLATCAPNDRLRDIAARLGEDILARVVDGEGVLLGRLWRKDVEALLSDGKGDTAAMGAMHPGPSTFRPDVPIAEMAEWFEGRKIEAFIVTSVDGTPLGALYREDVEGVTAEVGRMHKQHLEHAQT